jgi:drug/metabolite transporter (DMT)-like permease
MSGGSARGYSLGLLGVAIFALTLPMTRLAVGDASAPQLPPSFVTAGRAALAGLLSIGYLWWAGAPLPARA